tara:strand:+ start:179 stop:637 length:459 start_codon:yes stop_codon:yes gene_type:complete
MATTVTASTLSVSVTESITLNSVVRNSKATTTIASIGEISNRIMSIESDTNGTVIMGVSSTLAGAGTYPKGELKYLRITNLDDTNFIIIQFTDESAHYWELKLEAGKTLMIGDVANIDDEADIDNFNATAISKIIGKADTADCDIELYIAST